MKNKRIDSFLKAIKGMLPVKMKTGQIQLFQIFIFSLISFYLSLY